LEFYPFFCPVLVTIDAAHGEIQPCRGYAMSTWDEQRNPMPVGQPTGHFVHKYIKLKG
jgi:hypothetical protein